MVKRIWLLTGEPGSGKTTAIMKIVNTVRAKGYSIGGVVSLEKRVKGVRMGFDIVDLLSGNRVLLASVEQKMGPRVGKYRVNLKGLSDLAAKALIEAAQRCDLIVCDEIGPMEMASPEFRKAVKEAVSSGKPIIGVIHKHLRDPLADELRASEDVEVVEIDLYNSDEIVSKISEVVLNLLGEKG
ncbi:MAG: NTPase [Nitrososphaerales archaeon]